MPETLRVFVSSVMRGMESEREATRTAIASMHLEPWTFETLPAYPESPREVSLDLAKECDLFVQLIGPSVSPIVIEEYHAAMEDDPSKVLILAKVCPRDAEAAAHLESVSPEHKYGKYGDARDLSRLVRDSIAGWIQGGLEEPVAESQRPRHNRKRLSHRRRTVAKARRASGTGTLLAFKNMRRSSKRPYIKQSKSTTWRIHAANSRANHCSLRIGLTTAYRPFRRRSTSDTHLGLSLQLRPRRTAELRIGTA
jgi:hypothetical protein